MRYHEIMTEASKNVTSKREKELVITQAHEEGVYARKTGKSEANCPYVRNQEMRAAWLRGWASYGKK